MERLKFIKDYFSFAISTFFMLVGMCFIFLRPVEEFNLTIFSMGIVLTFIGALLFRYDLKRHCKQTAEERLRKAERKTNRRLKSLGIDTKELEDKTEE